MTAHNEGTPTSRAVHEYEATARCSCGFLVSCREPTLGKARGRAKRILTNHIRAERAWEENPGRGSKPAS